MGDVLLSKGAKGGTNLAEMQDLIRRINQANSSQAQALGGLLGYGSGGLLNPPVTGGLLGQ